MAERTRQINRVRWHLHEIDPTIEPASRSLHTKKHQRRVLEHLNNNNDSVIARLSVELIESIAALTSRINELKAELEDLTASIAPNLTSVHGVGVITAAKLIGEVAGIERFKSKDAFARYNGTAPLPVWSSNKIRHRLSRVGNRQVNSAIHRIALTQARNHPEAQALLNRRTDNGNTKKEAMRVLKRRLSDVVYRAMLKDATLNNP